MMVDRNLPEKILIVDSDSTVSSSVDQALIKYGIKVFSATDHETALYLFNQHRFDVVCIELDFTALPGLILLQKWRAHEIEDKSHFGALLLIGNRNRQRSGHQKLIQELRNVECLNKPFSAIQILPILSRLKAAKHRSLRNEEIKNTALKLGSKAERLDKAIGFIKKNTAQLGPGAIEIILTLYEKHQKWDEALQTLEVLMSKENNNIGYINAYGRVLMRMGRHSEALKFLQKADQAAPENLNRIQDLTSLYLELSMPIEAIDKMKQSIQLHPERPDLKFDMFSQLQGYGHEGYAQKLCEETTSPIEVVRYYNNKGVALKNIGNIDAALEQYEKSLKFYPKFKENYRIYYNIALAHIGLKTRSSYKEAIFFLDECLKMKKDFDKARAIKERIKNALEAKSHR